MDALILSCGTGGGHNAAGKAVMEELNRRNHHVEMLNPYTLHSDKLAEQIDRLYISMAKKAPGAFGALYRAGELYRKLPFRSPVYYVNQRMIPIMREYLEKHHFDIVIMPHLFPAEIMTNMKRRGMEIPRTMFLATDYCCIPFTEETECDAYVVPSAELEEDFARRGIPADRLYPYGIPVSRGFGAGTKTADERNAVLISGGSMGAGKIEKLVGMLLDAMEQEKRLQENGAREDLEQEKRLQGNRSREMGRIEENRIRDAEIVVVCGSNRELFWKLKKKYGRQIIVVGHTDHMDDYLKVSSLYITKPGGLSSTEAAVCGIPLLHMPPIPGCETYNARYFREHNMSRPCAVTEEGIREILELLRQEEVRRTMVDCQKRYIRSDSAVRICDLAEKLALGLEEQPEAVLRFRVGAGA